MVSSPGPPIFPQATAVFGLLQSIASDTRSYGAVYWVDVAGISGGVSPSGLTIPAGRSDVERGAPPPGYTANLGLSPTSILTFIGSLLASPLAGLFTLDYVGMREASRVDATHNRPPAFRSRVGFGNSQDHPLNPSSMSCHPFLRFR